MKMKKVLSIALSGILAVSMLAGCGSTKNVSNKVAKDLNTTLASDFKYEDNGNSNAARAAERVLNNYVKDLKEQPASDDDLNAALAKDAGKEGGLKDAVELDSKTTLESGKTYYYAFVSTSEDSEKAVADTIGAADGTIATQTKNLDKKTDHGYISVTEVKPENKDEDPFYVAVVVIVKG